MSSWSLAVVTELWFVLKEEVSVLPGWGSWANQQKEPHWMKAANQKAQRSVCLKAAVACNILLLHNICANCAC